MIILAYIVDNYGTVCNIVPVMDMTSCKLYNDMFSLVDL